MGANSRSDKQHSTAQHTEHSRSPTPAVGLLCSCSGYAHFMLCSRRAIAQMKDLCPGLGRGGYAAAGSLSGSFAILAQFPPTFVPSALLCWDGTRTVKPAARRARPSREESKSSRRTLFGSSEEMDASMTAPPHAACPPKRFSRKCGADKIWIQNSPPALRRRITERGCQHGVHFAHVIRFVLG